jgi:DNA mismatch endonuclease Vsr
LLLRIAAGWSSPVARQAHNLKVTGSNPVPATNRQYYGRIYGKPDVVLISKKVAIFCDSEFWHGRNWSLRKYDIKSNRDFWYPKIERNIKRDKQVTRWLKNQGWKVLRFWESEIEKNLNGCINKIEGALTRNG